VWYCCERAPFASASSALLIWKQQPALSSAIPYV
jgi:hypothetical protein